MQVKVATLGHILQKHAQFQWVLPGLLQCAHRALLGGVLRDPKRGAQYTKTRQETTNRLTKCHEDSLAPYARQKKPLAQTCVVGCHSRMACENDNQLHT